MNDPERLPLHHRGDPKDKYGWELSLFDVPNYPVLFRLLEEVWRPPTPAERSIPFGGGRRK